MNASALRAAYTLALTVLVFGVCQCSRPSTLLVTVNNVPAGAASLSAFITQQQGGADLMGPQADLVPYDLPTPVPGQVSFVLRLPDVAAARLTVSTAAFSMTGGTGCLLASGATAHDFQTSLLDDSVTIELSAAVDKDCTGAVRITSAAPAQLHASGGDKLTVMGWGFRPGSQIVLDGMALDTTYISAGQLEATVPAAVHVGLIPLRVSVPDQMTASFSGLRYVVDTVAFVPGGISLLLPFRSVKVGDLDGDGIPEVAALPLSYLGTQLTILSQTALLNFTAKAITLAPSLVDLAMVDVDKDGDLDLITITQNDKTLRVLFNDGHGNFTQQTQSVSFSPIKLIAGDLSGDGAPEVLLLDDLYTTFYTLPNDGQGHFAGAPKTTTLNQIQEPFYINFMDFDLDGRLDAVMDDNDYGASTGAVAVLLNQGQGFATTDAAAKIIPTSDIVDTPFVVDDLDGDGKADLAYSVLAQAFHLFLSTTQPPRTDRKIGPTCLAVNANSADLNGDGLADLMMGCAGDSSIAFMIQGLHGGFSAGPQAERVPDPDLPQFVATEILAADLTGDGLPELLVANNYGFLIYKNISH